MGALRRHRRRVAEIERERGGMRITDACAPMREV